MIWNRMYGFIRKWPWRRISGILCILLVCACFWLDREKDQLANKMLRLHVLANSDSREDQALKLLVRDQVLNAIEPWAKEKASVDEVSHMLRNRTEELSAFAEKTVREAGYSYPVEVKVESSWFPSRDYKDFSLPAGTYESLRVVIGEGEGKNWWCVVFPPLCMSSAMEETAKMAGLTEKEVFLILEDREEYVIKFKAIELWETIKNVFDPKT